MTAGLVISALTALLGATATTGAIAFAYAMWKRLEERNAQWIDSEDNRRRLLAEKGALAQQLADRDRDLVGVRATVVHLTTQLKEARASAVSTQSDAGIRDMVNGVPAHGGGASPAALPGGSHTGPATALPDVLPTHAPGVDRK